jgi:uncharacterized protein
MISHTIRARAGALLLSALAFTAIQCNGTQPPDASKRPVSKGTATMTKKHKHTNKLAGSTSPYLLQHAHNPVDWYPWGKEALDRAKKENKPIFLSIGYSSCHWCHVMERESFENEEVAKLMNDLFVSIKVDREERPDVDEVYMNAVQMMTGSGGWPLSVFLTPDLKPFLGGTYFPPEGRYGRPGFKDLLRHAAKVYRENPKEVARVAAAVTMRLERIAAGPAEAAAKLDAELMDAAVTHFRRSFDETWGGFGNAPKFPPTGALELMLRRNASKPNKDLLAMVTVTLDKMATGGMYDQLGGGFHRYSVDRQWLVPHFEKMLYDNALLAIVYLDAWRVTRKPLYRRTARDTLDYVLRVMTDEGGGFHSAEDADSEGVEGKYYVWTPGEIETVLGKDDAEMFAAFFGVTEDGNFEEKNILTAATPADEFARERKMTADELLLRLAAMKKKLLAIRDKRVAPGKDDKVLADWNGLMISAMARGYQVLGDERYRDAANKAADFVLTTMRPKGQLLHTYRNGTAHIDAFLDDYAFVIQGLLDLYEATFEIKRVTQAKELANEMIKVMWDEKSGGFYSSAAGKADLLVRGKDAYDGATPAGNGIAPHALLRLARLADDKDLYDKAEQTLALFASVAKERPYIFTRLLCAIDFRLAPAREVVIAGRPGDERTAALLDAVRQRYLPNTVVAASMAGPSDALPLLKARVPLNGKPAAYVCENYACQRPVTSVPDLVRLLEKGPQSR